MKTEKNIIKAYIIIVILSLLIILPPVFRAFFPKQKTVIGEDQGNITTINCTKDYHTEKISETVEIRYIDSKIKYTKIIYKPSTNTNQTTEEEDLTPSKELAYFKTLKDIAIELVEDKEHLEVRQMPSLDENVVVLHVYSAKNDIAKLIGRKGVMANSIRQLMSVAGRLSDKKLDIKFESYE